MKSPCLSLFSSSDRRGVSRGVLKPQSGSINVAAGVKPVGEKVKIQNPDGFNIEVIIGTRLESLIPDEFSEFDIRLKKTPFYSPLGRGIAGNQIPGLSPFD